MYWVVQKVMIRFKFGDNFPKCTHIITILTIRTRNLWRIKARLCRPRHLYFVTALPNKTQITDNINDVWFIDVNE